jgi:hypothetical protein
VQHYLRCARTGILREVHGLNRASAGFNTSLNGTSVCTRAPVACPSNCSGSGACSAEGKCVCDFGFAGPECEQRLLTVYSEGSAAANCPGNCSMRGACANGTCLCDPRWTGHDCALLVLDNWLCPGNCSSRGVCTANNTCHCDPGWFGSVCGFSSARAQEHCAFNCSGRGACTNGSQCACDAGWVGIWCERRSIAVSAPGSTPAAATAVAAVNGSCPRDCMGHGVCMAGRCYCSSLYSGQDCSQPRLSLALGVFCPGGCSGRGVCVDGACVCDPGFRGEDCASMDVVSCPANCSTRGSCVNGTCACDGGWSGLDCSVPVCQAGASRAACALLLSQHFALPAPLPLQSDGA